jgi:HEPN domain-containing protein
MTPRDLADAFFAKAAEDESLLRLLVADTEIADDIFGFHVQQAAEKLIKAVLALGQLRPSRTHDLGALLDEVESSGVPVPPDVRTIEEWSPYAVRNRYPFFGAASAIDRPAALAQVSTVRSWAEDRLGGPA